eukprot:194737_1
MCFAFTDKSQTKLAPRCCSTKAISLYFESSFDIILHPVQLKLKLALVRVTSFSSLTIMQKQTVLNTLFNNKNLSDIEIIVGSADKTTFYGLRAIFAAKSDVFKQMLYGDNSMIESCLDGNLIITDMSVSGFECFMKAVYDLEFDITANIVSELWYAAQKYMMDDLGKKCLNWVSNINRLDSFMMVLKSLTAVGLLDEVCALMTGDLKILKSGEELLNHSTFVDLHQKIVVSIISNDYALFDETTVWEQCIVWCMKHQHKVKNKEDDDAKTEQERDEPWKIIMKEFVPFIRFNSLNVDYFLEKVATAGVLSDCEQKEIAFKFLNPKHKTRFPDAIRWRDYDCIGPIRILKTLSDKCKAIITVDHTWMSRYCWKEVVWTYPGTYCLVFKVLKVCDCDYKIKAGIVAWNGSPDDGCTYAPSGYGGPNFDSVNSVHKILFSGFAVTITSSSSAYYGKRMKVKQTLRNAYPFISVCNHNKCAILIQDGFEESSQSTY